MPLRNAVPKLHWKYTDGINVWFGSFLAVNHDGLQRKNYPHQILLPVMYLSQKIFPHFHLTGWIELISNSMKCNWSFFSVAFSFKCDQWENVFHCVASTALRLHWSWDSHAHRDTKYGLLKRRMAMGNLNKSKENKPTTTTALKVKVS